MAGGGVTAISPHKDRRFFRTDCFSLFACLGQNSFSSLPSLLACRNIQKRWRCDQTSRSSFRNISAITEGAAEVSAPFTSNMLSSFCPRLCGCHLILPSSGFLCSHPAVHLAAHSPIAFHILPPSQDPRDPGCMAWGRYHGVGVMRSLPPFPK